MDRKNEKAIVTLGDEELSTVAGAGAESYAVPGYDYKSLVKFEDYSKYADIHQNNTATNIAFGGSVVNSQTNAAIVTQ
ncbi:MAG: hypothetical protein A2V77_23140 [Anaeromyxobacter sp. RBG_16_69_14]|nr:MAG: hypothetical protein A2V77_23140 [Anaeromyxobacter sp. RBG_16_69_14]